MSRRRAKRIQATIADDRPRPRCMRCGRVLNDAEIRRGGWVAPICEACRLPSEQPARKVA